MARLLTALLPFVLACSGATVRRTLDEGDDVLPVRAVAVYPYAFRWAEPPHRALGRAMQMVEEVLAAGRFLVIGPDEFTVLRHDDDDVFSATTLAGAAHERGFKPGELAVLRGWAEKRVASAVKELTDAEGKGRGRALHQEATVVAHLDVLHPASRRLLGSFEAAAEIDLFRAQDPDPIPELTQAMGAVTHEALDALGGRLLGAAMLPIPFRYAWNPRPALLWKGEDGRTTADALREKDALMRDVARRAVYAEFDPEGDGAHGRVYDKNPHGLLVLDPDEVDGLREGDLVTAVDGKALLGPHLLHRALNAGGPVTLTVIRAGQPLELALAPPGGRE